MRIADSTSGGFCVPEKQSTEQDGFSCMRGIDEFAIDPGVVFDSHSHRDVEILTYIVDGILDYRDDAGHRRLLMGGEVQLVAAGSGITHGESNASHSETLHVVQAWFPANGNGGTEEFYQQRYFPDDAKRDKLCLIASADQRQDSLRLSPDVDVYAGKLCRTEPVVYQRKAERRVWVQVARGTLTINDIVLGSGDSAAIFGDEDKALRFEAQEEVELLLFDMP